MAKEQASVSNANSEKLKALQLTIDKIEKNFGKGSIMRMGDTVVEDVPVISSGSHAVVSSRFMDQSRQVKPRLPFMLLPKLKKMAA